MLELLHRLCQGGVLLRRPDCADTQQDRRRTGEQRTHHAAHSRGEWTETEEQTYAGTTARMRECATFVADLVLRASCQHRVQLPSPRPQEQKQKPKQQSQQRQQQRRPHRRRRPRHIPRQRRLRRTEPRSRRRSRWRQRWMQLESPAAFGPARAKQQQTHATNKHKHDEPVAAGGGAGCTGAAAVATDRQRDRVIHGGSSSGASGSGGGRGARGATHWLLASIGWTRGSATGECDCC